MGIFMTFLHFKPAFQLFCLLLAACVTVPVFFFFKSRVERKTKVTENIFLKPLFRGNLDPFVNNANLGAIAHTSNGT